MIYLSNLHHKNRSVEFDLLMIEDLHFAIVFLSQKRKSENDDEREEMRKKIQKLEEEV